VPPEAANLVYGLLLIVVMRFRPQGLLPRSVQGTRRKLSDEDVATVRARDPSLFILDATVALGDAARVMASTEPLPPGLIDSKSETILDEDEDESPGAEQAPADAGASTEEAAPDAEAKEANGD